MNKESVLKFVAQHHSLVAAGAKCFNFLNLRNRIHSHRYDLKTGVVLLKGLKILDCGNGNRILIDDFSRLNNCRIIFHGSNNLVHIHEFVYMNDVEIFFEDRDNTLEIGRHCNLCGNTHFSLIEGTKITVGEDCMFSSNIQFRTGDSHSILDLSGKRINPSRDIRIGDHVWIGSQVTCLKGTEVADHCIAAACALLCRNYDTPHAVVGGVPGKIIKTNVDWTRQRIPME